MKRKGQLGIGTLVLALITFLSAQAPSAEWKTIVGTVSDYYQITTDGGDVYDVVENAKGDAIAEQMGSRVKVSGTVEDEGYRMVITISNYQIIEENETAPEVIQEEITPEETAEGLEQTEPEEESIQEEELVEENVLEEVEEEVLEEEDVQEEEVEEEEPVEENVLEDEVEEEVLEEEDVQDEEVEEEEPVEEDVLESEEEED